MEFIVTSELIYWMNAVGGALNDLASTRVPIPEVTMDGGGNICWAEDDITDPQPKAKTAPVGEEE